MDNYAPGTEGVETILAQVSVDIFHSKFSTDNFTCEESWKLNKGWWVKPDISTIKELVVTLRLEGLREKGSPGGGLPGELEATAGL